MIKLAVLGAGSWGLTLAWLMTYQTAANKPESVWLWDRNADKIAALENNRSVQFPVKVTLPESVQLTSSLADAIDGAEAILLVVTSNGTREVLEQIKATGLLGKKTILVNCSKGIEFPSLTQLSDLLDKTFPDNPSAVLSGPSLAAELLNGLPTASAVASKDQDVAEYLQLHLTDETLFRLYSNTDVIGVELGGALKNIFAIVSGYMSAKGLGDNAKAALITRGLAEMTRFSVALGADPKTLYGLSGLGDLLATCNSPLSRNYQVGARLAKGESLQDILTSLKVVAEGVLTTHAVAQLSEKMGLDMPVLMQVENCLSGPFSEASIIKSLMSRKLKSEHTLAQN